MADALIESVITTLHQAAFRRLVGVFAELDDDAAAGLTFKITHEPPSGVFVTLQHSDSVSDTTQAKVARALMGPQVPVGFGGTS